MSSSSGFLFAPVAICRNGILKFDHKISPTLFVRFSYDFCSGACINLQDYLLFKINVAKYGLYEWCLQTSLVNEIYFLKILGRFCNLRSCLKLVQNVEEVYHFIT